ncbi:hypothetical protein P7K49_023781 [Saguinus oedipus]|uniref:Uncharacterized protein n=1 Tax=Saguinus oedipus TaxID=9490 RepID=A0ABQ9UMP1_SAGOE|nr:hypothetical protein P7K49_023781 [Saguinus oedipus]
MDIFNTKRVSSDSVMGAVVAPLTILGGPLLIRAAWYTAGIVGGLSTVAMIYVSSTYYCGWCHSVLSGSVWRISSFQHVPSV